MDYALGWRTMFAFADSLFIVGGLRITLGALGMMRNAPSKTPHPFGSSMNVTDTEVRAGQAAKDKEATLSFAVFAASAGFGLVFLSILIHQVI